MAVIKKTVTAKAPSLGTVQLDNKDWVKADMATVKVGDQMEVSDVQKETPLRETPPQIESQKRITPGEATSIPFKSRLGEPLSQYDITKDRQILVSGIVQALIQSSLVLRLDDLEAAARKVLSIHKKLTEE